MKFKQTKVTIALVKLIWLALLLFSNKKNTRITKLTLTQSRIKSSQIIGEMMPDENAEEKLANLAKRIDAAREAQKIGTNRPSRSDDHHTQAQHGWRMVTELVAGLLVGFAIGYGMDTLFNTLPIFLIVFTLLGFAAGVRIMMQTAHMFSSKPAQDKNKESKNGN